ncbi:flagellar hook-length control protein FliK [Pseudophaeobacter sp.]|uniref:flagellar hook-length control protein FliK n=1 Tax=Pseudophaeobacter sp. TaxID=1971739 RepID=UPI00329A098D
MRQQANRSFSDHMDDRARRDEANSVSENKRAQQSEKAAEQRDKPRDKADGSKQADRDDDSDTKLRTKPEASADMRQGEVEITAEADLAEPDFEADLQPQDTAELQDPDTQEQDDTAEAEPAAEVDSLAVAAPQTGDVKRTDAKVGDATASASKAGSGAATERSLVAGQVAKGSDQVMSADTPVADEAEVETAKAPTTGSAEQGAKTPAQAILTAQAAEGDRTAKEKMLAAEEAAKAELAKEARATPQRPQDGVQSQSQTVQRAAATPETAANAKLEATALNNIAPKGDSDADRTAETLPRDGLRDGGAKAGITTEAAALAAGQNRASAPTEPGRRAQGRASEAREAQAVVTGNASPTSAAAISKANAAQATAVQQAFAAQALGADAAKTGGQGGESQLMGSESPSTAVQPGLSQLLAEAVVQPGTVHRPETPRMVAAQLAQAIVTKGDRNVDVALNPEELGRVKMRVSTSEAGITVIIQTERAETGDLMRRHINELADEFRKMGFENVSFEFNGGGASSGFANEQGSDQPGSGRASSEETDELAAATVAETQAKHLRLGNAGVDMRV